MASSPRRLVLGCVTVLLLVACSPGGDSEVAPAALGTQGGQWRSYAGDPGSSKWSPLDQIDGENFEDLEIAWLSESADVELARRIARQPRGVRFPIDLADFQVTPIMVDGVLYGSTSLGQMFALDAETGGPIWVHDPESYRYRTSPLTFLFSKHRGVAYWRDPDDPADERIFMPSIDGFLLAVEARTGRPVASFGDGGRVDLLEGLRGPAPEKLTRLTDYFQSSPPALYRDTVIVGSSIDDRPRSMRATPGDVRAYDARTGAQKWVFHTVPAEGEPGTETWEDGSWRYTGAANVWGPITVDTTLGVVYLTTSTPTNDFYGGHRPGDNLYAESLVALRAETRERLWHFQLTHHGLWDYDPGAAANLIDIEVDGRPIRAIAQVTKQGFTFVFDRVTGEPVWPITEAPAPPSDVPGERASPTQPVPSKPPPFELQGALEENLIDFTPELRAAALEIFRRYRTGPLYTPPSLRGTLTLPGTPGGSNWRGAGVDVESGVLYVPSIRQGMVLSVRDGAEEGTDFRYVTGVADPVWVPDGHYTPESLPLFKPPYSSLTAIDLNQGTILWQVPVGDGPRDHALLRDLELPPLGSGAPTCVLVTKTLVMAGEGAHMLLPKHRKANRGLPIFRAFDKRSGRVLGAIRAPGKIRGCPMTYAQGGRQYVVFSVGDYDQPAALVAYALPRG